MYFHRTDADGSRGPIPMGEVDHDGSFRLVSGDLGGGAPPGRYDVRVVWPEGPLRTHHTDLAKTVGKAASRGSKTELKADDRLKGVGVAFGVWLLLSVLYDGVVLTAVALFSDYPIERPLLGLMLANPVDLGRVFLLLRLDVSALMGYTGAVFAQFFGSRAGAVAAAAGLAFWIVAPAAVGAVRFTRKDF